MTALICRPGNDEKTTGTLLAFNAELINRARTAMSTRLKARPVTPSKQPPATTGSSEQFKRAVKLHQQGDLFMAETLYESLLLTEPHNLQVTYLLGLIGSQTQRPELARANVETYLATYPEDAQAISVLALAYFDLKDYAKARSLLEKSIAMRGESAHLYYNLGKTCFALQDYAGAVSAYDAAIRLQPDYIDALIGKAVSHRELKDFEIAACTLEHTIMREPHRAESHFFYGNVMRDMGETQAAIEAFETALILKPDYIDAAINCGSALKEMDRMDEAFAQYNRALALDPYHPEANYNKALALLLDGQFSRGWNFYEWRLRSSDVMNKFIRHDSIHKAPEWDGRPLAGHLLVIAEQGIGDQIFYAGMLGDLQAQAKTVTVCVEPRLLLLLRRSYPTMNFIAPEQLAEADGFDAQIYIGSLGRFYRADENALTKIRSPYLQVDAERSAQLRSRLKQSGRLLCGLSWRSKNADFGAQKSLSLQTLSQALCLPGLDFVDLQYGDTQDERQSFETSTGIHLQKLDDIDNFKDIDDLAALISACDIVVTVSNTTAHLAAALGKPTLVLLPHTAALFWYWHRESEHSPWYPTARLFRQDELGDWSSVIDALTLTLAGLD
jgi:tetratricopeptide (TPR) repeat protein